MLFLYWILKYLSFGIYMIKVDKIMKTGYNYVVRKVRNILLENGGFYMELAKQTTPVIEVAATKKVTVIVSEGKELEIKDYKRDESL